MLRVVCSKGLIQDAPGSKGACTTVSCPTPVAPQTAE